MKNGIESPLEKIFGVCVYHNNAYLLTATRDDDFLNTAIDPDFKKIPKEIQKYFLDFWKSIDKK